MSYVTTRTRAKARPWGVDRLRIAALALIAALLAACGGGEEATSDLQQPTGCDAGGCGKAIVTMTDAPGDFLSYTVDVTSLKLRRADGTEVQTLPTTSRIDFTELVDLDEVISAGQIPAGVYVAATLNLDYGTAEILVEDDSGEPLAVTPVDADGQPRGAVEMLVRLDERNHLRINAGRTAYLAFDLNLEASNTVSLQEATVTVSPFIVASVVPQPEREKRVRGRLASVDVAGSSYTIDVRPFHVRTSSTGQLVVHTTSATTFEVNGEVSTGAAGLTALAALTDAPMVVAFGTLQLSDYSFTAQRVLAGSSLADSRRDFLTGNVLARDGNTLQVAGARLVRRDGRFGFVRGPVTLLVGPDTRVTRAAQGAGSFDIDDISVGQRVQARGDVSGDLESGVTMDATGGAVRMDFTRLFGTVTDRSVGALALALELHSIDGRNPARFDFTGTGMTPELDADPANYEVATGVLDSLALAEGSFARLFGFVTPFGMAPPDFTARTMVDYGAVRAGLHIHWVPDGTATPFAAASSTSLELDLEDPEMRLGLILQRGRPLNIAGLLEGLSVVPAAGDDLRLAIAYREARRIENFSSFADFSNRLAAELDGTTVMLKMVGEGQYDAPDGQFRARQLLVVLGD